MFKNFLVSSFRNFQRRKQYALLSILMMVIGLSTVTLTFLYARYEFSYENWIKDSDSIYRVELTYHFPGAAESQLGQSSMLYGPALMNYFSEVEAFSRSVLSGVTNIRVGEIEFAENNVAYVDTNFIDFFGLELMKGNRKTPLNDLTSILLSKTTAEKYFGSEDPIGQVLTINNFRDHIVVGVFYNLPENTHLAIDFLALYDETIFTPFTDDFSFASQWNSGFAETYIKLRDGAKIEQIRDRIDDFTDDNYVHPNPVRAAMIPTEFVHTRVRPIKDIHLFSKNTFETKPSGSMGSVLALIGIAVLILATVMINYFNLATALSTIRAKEIGLRKTMGAKKSNITAQFIIEAIILSTVALIISLGVTEFVLPFFTQFLNLADGTLKLFDHVSSIFYLAILGLGLGFLSGIYPAFFLSKIKPAEVLSVDTAAESATSKLRPFLISLQFSISIGLLIAIGIVYQQTNFVTNMDIGVETKNITVFGAFTTDAQAAQATLINQISGLPGVLAVGASSTVPTNGSPISTAVEIPGRANEDALSAWYASVDEGFFDVYKLAPIAGRLFSDAFPADRIIQLPDDPSGLQANVLINEKSLAFLEFENPNEAIGQQLRIGGSNFNNSLINFTIIGVVPNFQFGSAYDAIQPTFFIQREDQFFQLSVRTTPGAFQSVQEEIDAIWQRVMPEETIARTIMTEMISTQYDAVNRQGSLLAYLSVIAIVISSLGIFGMASFTVQRKTLEIGIRKILGAHVPDIIKLLLVQFSKPIILANIIAWPVAWYLLQDWLEGFVYRISLTPMPFVLAGMTSLVIAWAIISGQVFHAARAKPIHALRDK